MTSCTCRGRRAEPHVLSRDMRRFLQQEHDADLAAGLICTACDRPKGSYLHTMPDIAKGEAHAFQPLSNG